MIDRKSPIPLYQQLFTIIKQKIISGALPVGSKLPGEDEIVTHYDVSRTTVRQAIESLVQEGLVSKQQGKGTFVLANRPKQFQNQKQKKSIAFLLPDLMQEYTNNIAASVVSKVGIYLQDNNFNLVLAQSGYSLNNENKLLENLAVDNAGIIWMPEDEPYRSPNHAAFKLIADGYPLLLFDKTIKGLGTGYVITDNYGSIANVVQHLISLGHKYIAFFGTPHDAPTSAEDRLQGFLHTIAKNGLPINYNWILPEGEENLQKLLLLLSEEEHPTAIVCKDDINALKVIEKATSVGIEVPNELSVTGFDDLELDFCNMRLTTARQDPDLLGKAVAEQIIMAINNSLPLGKVVVPAPLIIGNTTTAPNI